MSDDDMEMLLRRYAVVEPEAALRGRVVESARAHNGFFWEALAAGVLVVLSLIQVSGSAMAMRPMVRLEPAPVPPSVLDGLTEEEQELAQFALAGSGRLWALPQPRGYGMGAMSWETH